MKKLAYISTIFITLALMSFSCEKPNDDELSYQLQYSDWKNLSWVSTDGNSLSTTYPKLNISIDANNQIKVNQPYAAPVNGVELKYSGTYTKMSVNGNTISFENSTNNAANITGTFTKDASKKQITIITYGHTTKSYKYILDIH